MDDNKLYIGASTIANIEAFGPASFKVSLSDGSVEYLTQPQLEAVQSEEPYRDGEISMRKWKPTIESVLKVLLDSNMQMGEKDWIMQQIDTTIIERYKEAVAKKFSVSLNTNVTLQMVEDVLKS